MIDINQVVQMFNSNLDFPIKNTSQEIYTNQLINKQMNYLSKIIQDNKEKIVVIDYKDDVLSLICYRLIKNLQNICSSKFKIYLYGKTFNTKKDLVKKEKKIFSFKLKKEIKNNNVILISPYNPIYEVLNSNTHFNKFGCPIYKPFQYFTIQQIEQTQIFYHIGYYKKDLLQINSNNTLLLEYTIKINRK